jgi:hypothetical protein
LVCEVCHAPAARARPFGEPSNRMRASDGHHNMFELAGDCDRVHSVIEADEQVWPRLRLDWSACREEDET